MDNNKLKNEMLNVVKSGQAKQEIELSLKNLDEKALSSEGKIKSYEVDYDSVEHNPMGAIMFNVIINNNSSLIATFDLNKHSGVLEVGGIGLSEKLSDMLRK